jgi:transcriptional regulator with XRE-family HTH domain
MREAEAARLASGTSYAAIGRALRLAPAQVAQILRGRSPSLSIVRAAQVLEAVGLELSAKAYVGGPPLRDRAHLALLARLRSRSNPDLTWREELPVIEVAVAGHVDHRAWDAGIDGIGVRVRVEAETHVGDAQALERRLALKQRDGHEACVLLLLSDTRHHRTLLREAGHGLRAAFPVPQRAALSALRAGRSPGGNALVLL